MLEDPVENVEVALPISLKSFEFVLSSAKASISSNNMIILFGYVKLLISLNIVEIFFCVCPNLLSISKEKSTIYISLSNILAICLTASVLPVPGAP